MKTRVLLATVLVALPQCGGAQRPPYEERTVIAYAQALDVATLDSELQPRRLDDWLRHGPPSLDTIVYRVSDCDINSGIYLYPGPNGIVIIDRWPGNPARAREVTFGGGPGRSNDANAYSVITAPAGECGCGSN